MPSVDGRLDKDLCEEIGHFRSELKGQFRRNCVGYFVALLALFLLSAMVPWALCGAAVWTAMLAIEAHCVFSKSETENSERFHRWQKRQLWVAAGTGDQLSLKRLQQSPKRNRPAGAK